MQVLDAVGGVTHDGKAEPAFRVLVEARRLDLFGRLHDDKYYRAFNILNYEV